MERTFTEDMTHWQDVDGTPYGWYARIRNQPPAPVPTVPTVPIPAPEPAMEPLTEIATLIKTKLTALDVEIKKLNKQRDTLSQVNALLSSGALTDLLEDEIK